MGRSNLLFKFSFILLVLSLGTLYGSSFSEQELAIPESATVPDFSGPFKTIEAACGRIEKLREEIERLRDKRDRLEANDSEAEPEEEEEEAGGDSDSDSDKDSEKEASATVEQINALIEDKRAKIQEVTDKTSPAISELKSIILGNNGENTPILTSLLVRQIYSKLDNVQDNRNDIKAYSSKIISAGKPENLAKLKKRLKKNDGAKGDEALIQGYVAKYSVKILKLSAKIQKDLEKIRLLLSA